MRLPTRRRIWSPLQSRWMQMTLTVCLPGVLVSQPPTISRAWSSVTQEVEAGLGPRSNLSPEVRTAATMIRSWQTGWAPFRAAASCREPSEGSDGPPCTFLSCGPAQASGNVPFARVLDCRDIRRVRACDSLRRREASECGSKGRMGVTSTRHAFVEHQQ